ncbi:MFS transporter [Alteromonas sp. 1_MG-2023]|uniref:MFS transporter n=1 Tax=Alteromonas sp. 1_MG-2023 TaxID=3062669 RepID=UPI0026E3E924|nr:MFS transporter [Alteromonas sp. 1_MG-2023]MDO6566671.1 MFS transporter [Alteromonas sp. 1_MG-2023]
MDKSALSEHYPPALIKYVVAAILARTATGGAIVAIVLLSSNLGLESKAAGILAACLTLPHLLGPVYGRWLDGVSQPKYLISAAAFSYTGFFLLAIFSFERQLAWLLAFSLLLSGVCSSFIMGGLGTQLPSLAKITNTSLRKAQSWDTITYGVGHTVGPFIVATLSALYSAQVAVSVLVFTPMLAGLLILTFPVKRVLAKTDATLEIGFKSVFYAFKNSSELVRTMAMTSGAAFSVAALPVLAVYLSTYWQHESHHGAYLVTAYGVGNLSGALFLIFKPLSKEPLTLLKRAGSFLLLALVATVLSPSFVVGAAGYWLCGVANAIFFTSSLAARTEFAPVHSAAQTYMWVAAAKVGAGAIGALIAGALLVLGVKVPLAVSCSALALVILGCFVIFKARKLAD